MIARVLRGPIKLKKALPTKKYTTKPVKKVAVKFTKKNIVPLSKNKRKGLSYARIIKKANLKTTKQVLRVLTKKPVITTTRKVETTTASPIPANWVNVLQDLVQALKAVELKQNTSACNKEATTVAEILSQHLTPSPSGRRSMSDFAGTNLEDVISVLLDGVEIDKSENEVLNDFSDTNNEKEASYNEDLVTEKSTDLNTLNTISYSDNRLYENSFTIRNRATIKYPLPPKTNILRKPHVKSFFEALKARYKEVSRNMSLSSREMNPPVLKARSGEKEQEDDQEENVIIDLDALTNQAEIDQIDDDKEISGEKLVILDLAEPETADAEVTNVNSDENDIVLQLEKMETKEDTGENTNALQLDESNNPDIINKEPETVTENIETKEIEAENETTTEAATESPTDETENGEIEIEVGTEEPETILDESVTEDIFKYILDDGLQEKEENIETDTLSILDKRFSGRRFRSPRVWQHKLNNLKNVGNV
ncbi:uncharacterized protein LOC113493156 [Trichoplusia ni]|uniref:Uncharacterized protein LOC113493156 n=1 Tax=Trichoplusia ni TaxID=7111 RepID=A0A7E5VEQ4_TRINI|nr:uncharacterized protein LOC113493156 [Trichoplusia ni]